MIRKKAEAIVNQVCAGCHGVDGNSVAPANPKLAGLNEEYILKQLTNFKSGERKSAVMAGMVANLTPDDMKNLAAYFSAQQPKPARPRTRRWRSSARRSIAAACRARAFRRARRATARKARAFRCSFRAWPGSTPITSTTS